MAILFKVVLLKIEESDLTRFILEAYTFPRNGESCRVEFKANEHNKVDLNLRLLYMMEFMYKHHTIVTMIPDPSQSPLDFKENPLYVNIIKPVYGHVQDDKIRKIISGWFPMISWQEEDSMETTEFWINRGIYPKE